MREKRVVNVTFEPSDYEKIRQYAKASGISLASFLRMNALRAISKGE